MVRAAPDSRGDGPLGKAAAERSEDAKAIHELLERPPLSLEALFNDPEVRKRCGTVIAAAMRLRPAW